jgi:hypothetical protein
MFNSKYLPGYLITLGLVVVVSSYSNFIKDKFKGDDNENEMIKDYLLNESPLYGKNKPKLWIHSKYEMNARRWKDFYSRNTKDLNQDYLHLTIKTIINHNGDDFNICLIDDDSFSKLLPNWDIDLSNVAEPIKDYFRNLAMCQLLYTYGGMVVPNSLVCLKSLTPLYNEFIHFDKMRLINGNKIGVKTTRGKPILLEEICEEAYVDLHSDALGIYIPSDEILSRTKYQWIAYASIEQILQSNMIIGKYMKASITDTTNEYYTNKKERSVVTI